MVVTLEESLSVVLPEVLFVERLKTLMTYILAMGQNFKVLLHIGSLEKFVFSKPNMVNISINNQAICLI